ncbi:hypothetical protein H0H81_006528 [Sphagnurus paluster]|uniref:Protein kinase domain-containing protein n=1 Tax=Sphagnurus paluster TaxID=117069 RepID=A0A9P7GJZ9_9AGAR|nr:hypothetical protein H0H81_006528 [Sphagnurus paluster]
MLIDAKALNADNPNSETCDFNRSRDLLELEAKFMEVVEDEILYKRILACEGEDAQNVLDTLQSILQYDALELRVWKKLTVAMKRLSKQAELYPRVFNLDGVKGTDSPVVASGGFGDIRQGTYNGQEVCLKTIRAYQNQKDKIAKENILVDSSSRAYIADFGLSGVDDPTILRWTSLSASASSGGSTRWQAPELFMAHNENAMDESQPVTPPPNNTKASDVYAWSCVCYEIFTGKVPFYNIANTNTAAGQIIHAVMSGKKPLMRGMEKKLWVEWGLTHQIWALMDECWNKNPDLRPDIQTVLSRLEGRQFKDDRKLPVLRNGLEPQSEHLINTLPLTLERLNEILSGPDGRVVSDNRPNLKLDIHRLPSNLELYEH